MRYFLSALLLLFSLDPASACSCYRLTECDLAARPILFIGKVVAGGTASIRDDPWYTASSSVRFEVVEVLRGLPAGTRFVTIETTLLPGMCSPNPYYPGRTYLVTPEQTAGKLSDSVCFTGRDIQRIPDIVSYLRRQSKNPRFQIRGQVAAAGTADSSLLSYAPRTGDAKPLTAVTVSATANGKTVSTTTDEQGRYELEVPGPEQCEVSASLSPYPPATATIAVPVDPGCANRDPALLSGSSITGKLLTPVDSSLEVPAVGLVDLDSPQHLRTVSVKPPGT